MPLLYLSSVVDRCSIHAALTRMYLAHHELESKFVIIIIIIIIITIIIIIIQH